MRLVVLAALTFGSPAHADTARAELAKGMAIEERAIVDLQEFRLDAGPYHRAIVGRFRSGDLVIGGAVLTWCDAKQQCWLAREWLQRADAIDVLGVIDLGGAPAKFPTARLHAGSRPLCANRANRAKRAKWPALLVRVTHREQTTSASRYGGTKTGEHRRVELAILSLAPADVRDPLVLRAVLDERWPTGAGVSVTFELAKGGELVATEQRHLESASTCIRPAPTTTRYAFDAQRRRFVQRALAPRTGC